MSDWRSAVSRRRLLASVGAGVATLGLTPVVHQGSVSGSPIVLGHRGAAGLEPPNTVAGIERAAAAGAHGVSLDVRQTADGALVLFHDPFLDLATDGSGSVEEATIEEIRELTVEGDPIPTLHEGLEAVAGTGLLLFLELKKTGYTAETLEAVGEFGMLDRTVVTSFKEPALQEVGSSRVGRGILGSVPQPELLEKAADTDSAYVMSHYTPYGVSWLVDQARSRGIRPGIWELVSTETHIRDALSFDIDVLTTNRPDIAIELIED